MLEGCACACASGFDDPDCGSSDDCEGTTSGLFRGIRSGLRTEFRGPRGFPCPLNVERDARPVVHRKAGGRRELLHIVDREAIIKSDVF